MQELLEAICRIAIEQGGFRMAWIGLIDPQTKQVKPAAYAGEVASFLDTRNMTLDESVGEFTAAALRAGEHVVINDHEDDLEMVPWRADALRMGYPTAAVFPLMVAGDVRGTFNVYAAESDFFEDDELTLLDEMAEDIAFALEFIAEDEERRLAELLLRESEERYQTLARISPVGIFRTDLDGATTYVSPKWCEITGLSFEAAQGKGWFDAVHPDDKEQLSIGWQKSLRRREASFADYRFLRSDGTIAWVMGQAVPEVNSENQIVGYVGTITDITERKRAEAELHRLNAELEERVVQRTEELRDAMFRAQDADRMKSAFLATMSHELRTPLNSIIGFTGVLLQELAGPLNAEQKKQLGMTRDSARHLLALINDVLDISKIEAGQLEVARAPFEVHAAVEVTLRAVSPQAQKKGLALAAAIASDVGIVVSDRRRVEQVLLNLLSNAIKFTERGEVRLECRKQGGWLEISVSDTGIGIRSEDLGKLFEPFQQLESGLNRRHEGTGLGLAICKNLVGLLGGQIRARSEWGAGSTFTFTLPLAQEGVLHGARPDH